MRSRVAPLLFLISTSLVAATAACDGTLELGTNDGGGADARSDSKQGETVFTEPDGGSIRGSSSGNLTFTDAGGSTRPGSSFYSGDASSGGGDGGAESGTGRMADGGFVTPTECAGICETTAANGCDGEGGDLTAIDNQCVTFCSRSPNAEQMACFQATPCTTLISALVADGPLCGVPVMNTLLCYNYTEGCVCYYDAQPPEAPDTTTCTLASVPAMDAQPNVCCADTGYPTVAGTSCICSSSGLTCTTGQTSVSGCTN